jgi:hypothetical protein
MHFDKVSIWLLAAGGWRLAISCWLLATLSKSSQRAN